MVKRDPITKTSLSVCPSVIRQYLMSSDSKIDKIFTDDIFLTKKQKKDKESGDSHTTIVIYCHFYR